MSNLKVQSAFVFSIDMRKFFIRSIAIIFLLPFHPLCAQGERLASFGVSRLDGNNLVEIRWTLKANVSCQSPQVQRSVNKTDFNTVYTYPGVCGGSPDEESYSWIDQGALQNYKLYYRLRIDDAEYSSIDSVEGKVSIDENGVFVYPNPSSKEVFIRYEPSFGRLEGIRLYNIEGKEIKQFEKEDIVLLNRGIEKLFPRISQVGIYFIDCRFSDGSERKVKLIYRP